MATESPFKTPVAGVVEKKPSPSETALAIKDERKELANKTAMDKFQGIASFDWKQIPPPLMAELLMQTPFRGRTGEPDFYLAPWQAYTFAIRCYEQGLSPLSNEVWFNPQNNKTNVTFEGKLKLARLNNLNLSPPKFKRVPETGTQKRKIAGKDVEDYAYTCTIQSPSGPSEYTAWWSEWNVGSSPVWKAKPEHMLQLRAAEKCLSFATGTGASELPDEGDLTTGTEAAQAVPEVAVQSTEFKQGS